MKVTLALTRNQTDVAKEIAKASSKEPADGTVWHGSLIGYIVPKCHPGRPDYVLSLDGNALVYDGPRDRPPQVLLIMDTIFNGCYLDLVPVIKFACRLFPARADWYLTTVEAIEKLVALDQFRSEDLISAVSAEPTEALPEWIVRAFNLLASKEMLTDKAIAAFGPYSSDSRLSAIHKK